MRTEGGKMQTYYRLESSMGGYLGVSRTLAAARKLAIKLSNQHGYAVVRVFKAKRNALKETRGEIAFTAKPKSNPSKRSTRKRVGAALKKWLAKQAKGNPGRKVKGGRSVSLKNFSGTVIRKSNGQVVIRGRGKR